MLDNNNKEIIILNKQFSDQKTEQNNEHKHKKERKSRRDFPPNSPFGGC